MTANNDIETEKHLGIQDAGFRRVSTSDVYFLNTPLGRMTLLSSNFSCSDEFHAEGFTRSEAKEFAVDAFKSAIMERLFQGQPIVMDGEGRLRFKENEIVSFLLASGPADMTALAMMKFSQADRRQFAQLIGYSVSGYETLSYVIDEGET